MRMIFLFLLSSDVCFCFVDIHKTIIDMDKMGCICNKSKF